MVELVPIQEIKFNHPEITTPISPPPDELEHYIKELENLETEEEQLNQPPSLETLLSGLSKAPYSRVSFMSYLKSRHCAENLEFLMNSNQYILTSRQLQNNTNSNNYDFVHNEITQLWHHIYAQFISHDSPKEVNIPSDLKTQLTFHFHSNSLPQLELMETTMFSIKELLRDTYFQFISHVKRSSPQYYSQPLDVSPTREINDSYSLLPTSNGNDVFTASFRRDNRTDSTNSPFYTSQSHYFDPQTERAESPLSSESAIVDSRSNSSATNETIEIRPPINGNFKSDDYSRRSKNSFSEASVGLKKIAGKFRWRRLSSNSSTSSS